jgi:translation initiation factor IF-2
LAKRIFELAKELDVKSKAIIDKCVAEGIPEDKVKNHMATVSPGLEASIREWFAEASTGVSATAVEVAEHPDIARVRATRRRKVGVGRGDEGLPDAPDIDSDILPEAPAVPEPVAEPVETPAPVARTREPIAREPVAPPEPADAPAPVAPAPAAPVEPEPKPVVLRPMTPPAPAVTEEPAPTPASAAPAPVPQAPPSRPAVVPAPVIKEAPTTPRPAPTVRPAPPATTVRPAASAPAAPSAPPSRPPAAPEGPGRGPARPQPPAGPAGGDRAGHDRSGGPLRPITPAPMNVPTRPQVVAQVGKKLEVKTPVKLSGPRVVRIEAPEAVARPRPRREGGFTESGPPRGGAGAGPAGGDDDASRSPRRNANNKRRADGPVPERRKGRATKDDAAPPSGGMWSEQDLLEREARLQHSGGYLKNRRHQQKLRQAHGPGDRAQSAASTGGAVRIIAPFTLKDLSATTGVKVSDLVKKLFMQNIMATANSGIDPAKAQEIMIDFNIELEVVEAKTAEQIVSEEFEDRASGDLRSRPPIVTILGHVDHGKTSLLDRIRSTNVAAGEAGGITQKTSAFRVPVKVGGESKQIVFLDTPGHQAFTEMRARGATMTDIVVLVVSAPEGVMPQTIESINHAKAAKVPIVVALNKIDRPDATDSRLQQTLGQLAAAGLNPVEWGGDTEVVRTSATAGTGIEQLLEILDLQGQMLELKADYSGAARGTVIEAKMEEGRGAVANIMVQDGQLNVGDFIVLGRSFGRVRDIIDDRGERHKSVGPAWPVQISGIDVVPDAGDKFYVADSLKKAQEAAEQRRERERHAQLAQPKLTLDTLFDQMKTSDVKEILIVLKADVQGSVDVLKGEIEKVSTPEVKVRVLHNAVGGINESDVLLADASKAIIVGFNVIASGKARTLAESKGVEIRNYQVIYDIIDDVKKAAEGLLAPEMRQEVLGHAEVRKVFKVSKVGTIAGCYVTDGVVERDALVRVTRDGIVVENDRVLEQLKRFKDDAKEVRSGMECGMKIVGYDDIREGDIIECYKQVEFKRTLAGGSAPAERAKPEKSRQPEKSRR